MFSILGSICVGDKTSCGGTVITGSPFSTVNGKAIARIGDKVGCQYSCVIVSGNPMEIVDGAAIALHGALTSKQCTCLSQNNDYHGDGQSDEVAAAVPTAADAGIAFMPDTAAVLDQDHWIEFQLVNGKQEPISRERYTVIDPSGKAISGYLDDNGYARVMPVKAGICKVDFPDLGRSTTVGACLP